MKKLILTTVLAIITLFVSAQSFIVVTNVTKTADGEEIGIENIIKHEKVLMDYGQEVLRKNNSVKLIGNPKEKGAVLSFTIEGVHPHDIATILDEDGVAIRAGHHCCQILHEKLGIAASARASLGIYNTKEDFDKLNSSINNCKKIFNLK